MSRAASRAALAAALAIAVGGCATVDGSASRAGRNPADPWEAWNRKVFAFNEGVDEHVLKPVATAYRDVVPGFVRTGVSNFFNNVADGWSAINLLLQGRVADGLSDGMRFAWNTTFGLFGVVDMAGDMGFEHHYEDLGQTLGTWGMPPGPYIVWPLLGPSAVRESVALPLDRFAATPALAFEEGAARVGITTLQVINARAELLGATQVLDQIALDKYGFVRDAWLARRRSLVHDGEPPAGPGGDDEAPLPKYDDVEVDEAPSPAAPAASAPAPAASAPAR